MIEKGNRIKTNTNFEKDKKSFFKTLEEETAYEGERTPMEQFVEFWAGILEIDKRTLEIPWMEKVKGELPERVQNVNEFAITENTVIAEIRKRKNWTAPDIDGIQNYWWKRFQTTQKALIRAFERIKTGMRGDFSKGSYNGEGSRWG